jgi:hypothetical protein
MKNLMDASAIISAKEFISLSNITSMFLDGFHNMVTTTLVAVMIVRGAAGSCIFLQIYVSQAVNMANLRNLSTSTAALMSEMSKNTMCAAVQDFMNVSS